MDLLGLEVVEGGRVLEVEQGHGVLYSLRPVVVESWLYSLTEEKGFFLVAVVGLGWV